jgi:hypothetical protein
VLIVGLLKTEGAVLNVGFVKTDAAVPTLTPSGMLLRVTELVVPNVSKDSTAFIFKA